MSQAPSLEKTGRRRTTAPTAARRSEKPDAAAPRPSPLAGAGPRVDLMPPVVEVRRKQNATLRLLTLGLVGVVAIAVVASLAVWMLATGAESALADEQDRTAGLLAEQATYSELIDVKAKLADYEYVDLAALYAEADWSRIMRELDAALPAGVSLSTEGISVKGLTADTSTSSDANSVAIDAPGVIQVDFAASAPAFDSPTPLLNGLEKMTGYISADVSAVSNSANDGYVITGSVRLGAAALGGTARVAALDPERLKALQDALVEVATAPPTAAAPDTTTTDTTTGAGQ